MSMTHHNQTNVLTTWFLSESGLMLDSELRGGSPRPCWLRTDHLAPVNKFDYVLMHAGFMDSRKPSSFYN
jgi:hypothetical protein